ncbi:Glucan 1,4-alpha-glucosidase SusB [Thalassocella blandensis]|nr:Glucan 1,4-alpha-glucosidase SusB [Thalassocella blandensis]
MLRIIAKTVIGSLRIVAVQCNRRFVRAMSFVPIAGLIVLLSACGSQANRFSAKSPSGDVALDFELNESGSPEYRVSYKDQQVILPSGLGFLLDGESPLKEGFIVSKVSTAKVDDTWEQPWGEQRLIRNHYAELLIRLQEIAGDKRQLNLRFRVFDEGVAFRYEFPQQSSLTTFKVMDELTEFNLADAADIWWTPAQAGNQYEYLYNKTSLNEVTLAHTPATLKTENGLAVVLHEAALFNYSTMNLRHVDGNQLKAELVPFSKTESFKAALSAPFNTPWRTIKVAESENDLVTSYMELNLNEPNKLGDVSWVNPGKYIGIWWELHLNKGTWEQGEKHAATTQNTKKYIDFAAEHGFAGVLVEGWNYGWDGEWWNHGGGAFNFTKPYPDYDIDYLTKYAKDKGVFIIGHHETGAETDNYEKQLEDAYAYLEAHGMKAVKTGYVESGELLTNGNYHHGQSFVQHAEKVIQTAAKHHVMVVAHETVKDTGERRTYPNMISREVARGQEYNAWSEDGGNPPNHTTILPYTRMLSGPMDFTPGVFNISLPERPDNQVNTTLAKQLALYVVVYSPVQMACDLPENYEAHPDAFQFIKDVAVDWETSIVLGGEIGEYFAVARQVRNGDEWYVGAVTNEKARTVDLALAFLPVDTRFTATIYRDAKDADYKANPTAYVIESKTVSAKDSLKIDLATSGGVAVKLTPIDE